jgi:hypothetical protein
MKVSLKVKGFCYACVNIGVFGWSAISFLQGMSAQRTLLILVGALVMMNLLLWLLFRARDNGNLQA